MTTYNTKYYNVYKYIYVYIVQWRENDFFLWAYACVWGGDLKDTFENNNIFILL